MKSNQVKIGNTYHAQIAKNTVAVLILRRHRAGGWEAKNLVTNKIIRIKSAEKLSLIETVIEPTIEPASDSVSEVNVCPVDGEAVPTPAVTVKPQPRQRSKEVEIAPQPAISTYKPGDDIVKLAELLSRGVTKAEICQHFGWKSWNPHKSAVLKLGYGIRSDAEGKFWLVQNQENAA